MAMPPKKDKKDGPVKSDVVTNDQVNGAAKALADKKNLDKSKRAKAAQKLKNMLKK